MSNAFDRSLMTHDQLTAYAREIAMTDVIERRAGPEVMVDRLERNEKILISSFRLVESAAKARKRVVPAAIWLLDNFYLIEENIRTARRHLPKSYSRELPRLESGRWAGFPRVYGMALELVSHVDGRVDEQALAAFIAGYQENASLKIGELWAIPIMLRFALIENLRNIASHVAAACIDRNTAAYWADRIAQASGEASRELLPVMAELARSNPRMSIVFVTELARCLQAQFPVQTLPITWLEQQLSEQGHTLELQFQAESHLEAADQLSISNHIASLRFLDANDWRNFVEGSSVVEAVLREDPAGAYSSMDFATRDSYRHVVERLAKKTEKSELNVAKAALARASSVAAAAGDGAGAHVGQYLVASGVQDLEDDLFEKKPPLSVRLSRRVKDNRVAFYVGSSLVLAALITAVITWSSSAALAVPAFLVASQIGVSIVNWIVTMFARPQRLPRLELKNGLPAESRTMVVVPTMIGSAAGIEHLLSSLEVRYVANRDPHLYFALLTDFPDAAEESLPQDAALIEQAATGVRALNERYGKDGSTVFFLFHRPRLWNAEERLWMGWERKRGKLIELTRALRSGAAHPFARFQRVEGDTSALIDVRYVITLDTDTQLPRDAARILIGTMAHPLNKPRLDARQKRVTEGYAILQPRVATTLGSLGSSMFAKVFAGDAGVDPYTREVSDVYQDLFQEGSFIGKGIYEVDAFLATLDGRFPENWVLSHDLIESCYARSGLVSDVILYEDFPARYRSDASRRHRWIRGDWQIAPWLLPWVKGENGKKQANELSGLSRWKIADNLRRSLVAPAAIIFALLGWLIVPAPVVVALTLLALVALPALFSTVQQALQKPDDCDWPLHARLVSAAAVRQLTQSFLSLVLLPYDAAIGLDAVLRATTRMVFTRRKLLEWNTAHDVERQVKSDLATHMRAMGGVTIAALIAAPFVGPAAAPFIALWALSPLIAWWVSRPIAAREPNLTDHDRRFLMKLARKTWRYFETFVTDHDSRLVPDNYQEYPAEQIAHRTSPTNVGLALLSDLGAHDFGFQTTEDMMARIEATLVSMEKLERHRGHFYNWYDTKTLKPLWPLYVSTVDSGNFCGCMLVLALGLEKLAEDPFPSDAQAKLSRGIQATEDVREEVSQDVEEHAWWTNAVEMLREAAKRERENGENADDVARRAERLRGLAARARSLAACDFGFLYDEGRRLFAIGYNVENHRRDPSYYDLLASEARLASFLAVAHGQVPEEHWFALGRLLTRLGGEPLLLSWSGSMFEYLMPMLVLPDHEDTLLGQTCRAAVREQIAYGRKRGVPWGISESGYHVTDAHLTYQYRAFGVPGLGFKRGLGDDLVIAPYASMMALMVAPEEATANLKRMASDDLTGRFGFFEAIDYTPSRLPPNQDRVVIRSFMAHHQGMGFLSLVHLLLDQPMQRRLQLDPTFQATSLLLQENVPRTAPFPYHGTETGDVGDLATDDSPQLRIVKEASPPHPETHLLSNGRYHVVVTSDGCGYSAHEGMMLTRWRGDATTASNGLFCYIRDVDGDATWSMGHRPTFAKADRYEAIFSEGRAEFRRLERGLETHTQIAVSPEEDFEIRRITLHNRSSQAKTLELTSFAEIALAPQGADEAHPAFSKLFVQTEILAGDDAILAARRPRVEGEKFPWLWHALRVREGATGTSSFETDRAAFLGRTRDARRPIAGKGLLTGSAGSVLDPALAIRRGVRIPPQGTVIVDLMMGVGSDRNSCTEIVRRYGDKSHADRVFDLAWTQGQIVLQQLNIRAAAAQGFNRLAGFMLFPHPAMRPPAATLTKNRRPQSALWAYGISGDLPILLVRVSDVAKIDFLRQALTAHLYWRRRGFIADLVIWNEDDSSYRQQLHDQILNAVGVLGETPRLDLPGGIFVRRTHQLTDEDRTLFLAVARVVLSDRAGSFEDQIGRVLRLEQKMPKLAPSTTETAEPADPKALKPEPDRVYFNGHGGFRSDGKEYVIDVSGENPTPMPWSNVIANAVCGTVVTEAGGGYTWCENAHELRLTPWSNDPISDPVGEAIYLRDESTGKIWSPTLLPAGTGKPYTVRHGFGYSSFHHERYGIATDLTILVAAEAPVKYSLLRVKNRSAKARRITVTAAVAWVMGEHRVRTAPSVVSEFDGTLGALFAQNSFSNDFRDRVAFFHMTPTAKSCTADRAEFLGRDGSWAQPEALERERLSGRVAAGIDPCAALQVEITLKPGEEREVVVALGCGKDRAEARDLIRIFGVPGAAQRELKAVRKKWEELCGAVQVETSDPSFDFLCNGWLVYQTISSRLWARSGFYQSGGAFGFRDQLQDSMALLHAAPDLTRAQILRNAARQFREGDVQHWWHPPGGRGVRTKFSDDYLWLPLVTALYVKTTGDAAILDEMVPFLEGRELRHDEEAYYDQPGTSGDVGTLYEHCVRSIRYGLKFGTHGLPLMGCGDWNDGMNLVGIEGKGESVWLAFFLIDVLRKFVPLAEARGDDAFARVCEFEGKRLGENVEVNAWDGAWYLRAFYDNGAPMGSARSAECQIDILPQAWSVLSGTNNLGRATQAMNAAFDRLVRPKEAIVQLFDPPFDQTPDNPGYIKGYVPGVRENGGQYTHAAVWATWAYATLGDAKKAWGLLDIVNPLHHGTTAEQCKVYKVEPYVVAADVYARPPHAGRGGWTWYTGSSSWMYRLLVEGLLGIQREAEQMRVAPCLNPRWESCKVNYKYKTSNYALTLKRGDSGVGVKRLIVDGEDVAGAVFPLLDDGRRHEVTVETH